MKKYQACKELKSCSDFRFSMEQMEIEIADDEEERYSFNPCHDDYFYVLHSSPKFILSTYSIPVLSMYFISKLKTVWIQISWLHHDQKPPDLDLQ